MKRNPTLIILSANGTESISEGVKRLREENLDAPIVVYSSHLDLLHAEAALKSGARGFIHGDMLPEQMIRALEVVREGEVAAPRGLLEYMLENENSENLVQLLSARQREILSLVGEGFTNAQIAEQLFLSESTVKQHLRATYKVLGVRNRTEAAKLAPKVP